MADYTTNNTNEGGGGGTAGGGAIQDYRQHQPGTCSGGNNGIGNVSIKSSFCCDSPSSSPSSSPSKSSKIIALVVGFLLLAAGGITVGYRVRQQRTWISVDGTIVDTVLCSRGTSTSSGRNGDGKSNPTYAPVIEYRIENDGSSIKNRFRSGPCSWPPPRVGNTITVLYDPEDPFNAVNGSFVALWLAPIVLLLIAPCFCCLSCLPGTSRTCFDGYNSGSGGDRGQGYSHSHHHHNDTGGGGGWHDGAGGAGADCEAGAGGGGGECGSGGDCGGGGE